MALDFRGLWGCLKALLWGPIGAGEPFYWNLFSHLNQQGKLYYIAYNITNFIQWKFAPYINWCFTRADVLVSTTTELQDMLAKKYFVNKNKIFHIPETACISEDLVPDEKKKKKRSS